MYPIAAWTNRRALRDTVLPTGGGLDKSAPIFVPKGTNIWMHFRAMNYDEALWGPDAEEFRPERWADIKLQQWDFLPFGG